MPCQCILCWLFHFKYRFWISNSSFISSYKEKLQSHLPALASLTSYKHPQALDTTLIYRTGEPKVLLLYTPHLSSDRTYNGPSMTINSSKSSYPRSREDSTTLLSHSCLSTKGKFRARFKIPTPKQQKACPEPTGSCPEKEQEGCKTPVLVRGSGKINPTSSMLIFTGKKNKRYYHKEWCQICTNINNMLPIAYNPFILWKPYLLKKLFLSSLLLVCLKQQMTEAKRHFYGPREVITQHRVKYYISLTFSKNWVIFSAVASVIIFILKVNNISKATKTRILQDPLITLSQTLEKKKW